MGRGFPRGATDIIGFQWPTVQPSDPLKHSIAPLGIWVSTTTQLHYRQSIARTRSLIYPLWAGWIPATQSQTQTATYHVWMQAEAMHDLRKRSGNRCVDICTGEADGLCSILQGRLHAPKESTILALLDAVSRLVDRVHTRPGDEFLMGYIPIEPNRSTLLQLLKAGARVQNFNHHVTD